MNNPIYLLSAAVFALAVAVYVHGQEVAEAEKCGALVTLNVGNSFEYISLGATGVRAEPLHQQWRRSQELLGVTCGPAVVAATATR